MKLTSFTFMRHLCLTGSTRLLNTLSILTLILTIAPTVQAAPRSMQTQAMQDQSVCFIQLPGKATTNLNKLCGLGFERNPTNQSNIINIDIDVDRDGVSDQLLEATLQTQNFIEAETKRLQANQGSNEQADQIVYEAYSAAARNANLQLEARLPFSDQVKQALAKMRQIDEKVSKYDNRPLNAREQQEVELLVARNREISQSIDQDPTLLKVNEAQSKVYAEIDRRRVAKLAG
ncbi:hypothetical protein ACKFKF_11320 [Phormidesmis sp. 146-12]